MLATDLLNDSPPAEEVLSEDETARRLEVARFMGPPFKTAQLQFYSLMTGPLATAAMVSQNADWGLALARRDVGGLEAVLATAPLLEDKIHKAMAAAGRQA